MRAGRQAYRRLAGALLLIGIVAVVVAIFMLDELVEAARGRTEVVAVLSEAGGVRRGTPVWIAGKPAGRVKRIDFLPRRAGGLAQLAVTLEIVGRDRDQLRRSSRARVATDGLVGGAVIDIIPAPATNPRLGENDTIYGRPSGSADAVRAGAASLKAAIDSLTGEVAPLIGPARRFALRADHVQRNLSAVQAELAAVERLLQPRDGRILLDSAFLAKLDRLMATSRELGTTFRQARSRYTGVSTELVEPIARLQRRADSLSVRIASFNTLINAPAALGAPTRIRADSAIFGAIHGVRAQLDSLIAEVRRDPFKFAF